MRLVSCLRVGTCGCHAVTSRGRKSAAGKLVPLRPLQIAATIRNGVVGRRGVIEVLEPDLSDEEQRGLEKSADVLRAALNRVG